ncbi:MAG: hypothetical protein M1828_004108 [Chrysothrix sp. TS-e1954]|nr:MAG: hypothetical protein M1828_004108 [Chrysothrix sp. TS-e1954]
MATPVGAGTSSYQLLSFDTAMIMRRYLSLPDIVALRLTCKSWRSLFNDEMLSRQALLQHASFSPEASVAASGKQTYRDTITRLVGRDASLGSYTKSVFPVDDAASFIYRDGYLARLDRDQSKITISHIHDNGRVIAVIGPLTADTTYGYGEGRPLVSIWNYEQGVLTYSLHSSVDFTINAPGTCVSIRVEDKNGHPIKPFIVHERPSSFRRAEERHVSLRNRWSQSLSVGCMYNPPNCLEVFLRHFPVPIEVYYRSSDEVFYAETHWRELSPLKPGKDFACEIFDDLYLAVDLRDADCRDGSGSGKHDEMFYSCFSVDMRPNVKERELKKHDRFRRLASEGPVSDNWTRLSLQRDQATNEILIVESRVFWPEGRSSQRRIASCTPFWGPMNEPERTMVEPTLTAWEELPEHLQTFKTLFTAYSLSKRAFIDFIVSQGSDNQDSLHLRLTTVDGNSQPVRRSRLLEQAYPPKVQHYKRDLRVSFDERTLVYSYGYRPCEDKDDSQQNIDWTRNLVCRTFDPCLLLRSPPDETIEST